jgi:hypothetical protein
MTIHTLKISFPKIMEISLKGINRSYIFIGFGVNAIDQHSFNNYSLDRYSPIQIVPSTEDATKIDNYKNNFKIWLIGCGLRELTESFSIFIDKIYQACTLAAISKGKINKDSGLNSIHKFPNNQYDQKLRKLNSDYNISLTNEEHFCSIIKARNCITHRLGIVDQRDMTDDEHLRIRWFGIDLYVRENNNETKLDLPLKEPLLLEKGGEIISRNAERNLLFNKNELIKLNPHNIYEICLFFRTCTMEIISKAQQYIESIGY